MKTFVGLLAFFLGAASCLRAGDGKFEIRAVASRPGLPGTTEYILDDGGGDPVKLSLGSEVLLDASALVSAEAKEESGFWLIAVELTAAGKARLGEITTKFLERRLAVLINGKVRCAPVVSSAILDGSFKIGGDFTEDDVKGLAADLNAAVKREPPAPAATPGNP